jgi:RNA polymerase sigma-70 factor (ECF subfamily)
MDDSPLESLLGRLSSGDVEAAQRAFVVFEPYLRRAVRRRLPPALRAKFDSADIVQSIFADLLDGFRESGWRFNDVGHLRAFLLHVTRNRFIDRVRQAGPVAACQQPLTAALDRVATSQPRPSECAQAEETWQKLLALCPPDHQEVLRLRRLGLTRVEIAARTGLHEGSIRRILRGLARRLAFPEADSD